MRLEISIVADTAEQYSRALREFADEIDAGKQNDNAVYEIYDDDGRITISFGFDAATDVFDRDPDLLAATPYFCIGGRK